MTGSELWKTLFLLVIIFLCAVYWLLSRTEEAVEDENIAKVTLMEDQGLEPHVNNAMTEPHGQEVEVQVLFLGDSIIGRMKKADVWRDLFEPLNCLNLGKDGDTTQDLMERIANGQLDNIKSKVVVLLIGTNNIYEPAEKVADSIVEIVNVVREKQPQSQILVLELFPKGQYPSEHREKNSLVNKLLRDHLQSSTKVSVINLDPGFVRKDNLIDREDMIDFLHFSNNAYTRAFSPLRDIIVGFL